MDNDGRSSVDAGQLLQARTGSSVHGPAAGRRGLHEQDTGQLDSERAEIVAANKQYFKLEEIAMPQEVGVNTLVSDPLLNRRLDKLTEDDRLAHERARSAVQSEFGRQLARDRTGKVERSLEHVLDCGGARRTTLRARENIRKRYLIQAACANLSLLMRRLMGVFTPRRALAGAHVASITVLALIFGIIAASGAARRPTRRAPFGLREKMRLAVRLTAVMAMAGCGTQSSTSDQARTFVATLTDTLFVVGGSASDTVLLNPNAIRPWLDGVVVLEAQGGRLVAIDGSGSVKWLYSRPGQGPGEMLGPVDGFSSSDGMFTVLDYANRKFVRISPDGEFMDEVRLPGLSRLPWEVAPMGTDGALVADNSNGQIRLVDVDTGETLSAWDVPVADTVPARANRMVALSSHPDRNMWAMAMKWGPSVWIGEGKEIRNHFLMVHQPGYRFPRPTIEVSEGVRMPDPSVPPVVDVRGATSLSIADDGVLILTGGAIGGPPGAATNDILDAYDLQGTYRGSLALPVEAFSHAKVGSSLFLLFLDPAPGLLALRYPDGT